MDMIDCLMKAGFTRHESTLYLALCKDGELTGYEASKVSRISRSNAYLALAGLVEKGGAFRIDGDVAKYIAVPAHELVFNLRGQLEQVFLYIEENTPLKEAASEPYVTITGKAHILNKMCYILSHAVERIYLSVSHQELESVRQELAHAKARGLKVVIITSPPFIMDGVVIYFNEKQPGQIRLIADTSQVLTGEIADAGESSCLYSMNKNLIQLIKDSLTNEIKLIQLKNKT